MTKLKPVDVFYLARLQAVVATFLGLVAGVLYAGVGAIYDAITGALGFGTILAFFAIIAMPIIFAFIGFVTGIIEGYLYNWISQWVDEIKKYFK